MTTIFASSLLRTTARASVARAGTVPPRRFTSTMHDNDPELLDLEKKRNLSKTQHATSTPHAHAPGWNEHLASASEAHVKADKSTGTPEELADQTVKYMHNRHSPENDLQPTEALYSRDEVGGPLGSAESGGKVMEKTVEKKSTTKVFVPTPSEESVKADRNEI